ncbi:dihydrodipicolinate synthetase [Chthoniobacter flavus Ellin428]|uniref:Dihydrodipicolinate synthetase n=1 Tax=Chthoniobacter flavus Ellin428 TaxID=497964 RepID=B4D3M9_9BACT|nr:dihydrodipicolinate synthase family protein [Chthoniobacter flavus]EDY18859.1 dihydrodipicolinate synthetase [Chthoniobacter flavus Ellin428]TCO93454.1 N-acetylneuraminate lyase [Chthoniobacter flavus]
MSNFTAPLTGLISAPFTAFHNDGSLNLQAVEKQVASLVANGVSGAFVCGTTGEGISMTVEERMRVAERWQQVAEGKLQVVVHVGHTSLGDARALAAHTQKIGAQGTSTLAPYFFKPGNAEDLAMFCAEVASAAPALPFYYYQIPSMTGVNIPAADFLRAAAPRIPNLAGVKFTFENLMDFSECVRLEGGRYNIVFGRDEILVAGLSLGARGAIGSTYNFIAPIFHEIIAAFEKGDLALARERQAAANAIIQIFIRYGGPPAGKVMMKMIGVDCGPVRLPLRELSPKREEQMRAELEAAGFFQMCSRG